MLPTDGANQSEQLKPGKKLHPHAAFHVDRTWLEELQNRTLRNGPWDDWTLFQLTVEAEQTKLVTSFDELQCMRSLPAFEPMEHQISTARKVLHEMGGRAILADEVGLGKTIEAGLVLKEYLVRGLVRKVLILVPASLVLQWVRELNTKFGIAATAQRKHYSWQNDIVVASIDTAKREQHRDYLLNCDYDMLIIDEAHKLKNKKTTNYQFVQQLRKKYCLLLTATPVQNDLDELYNLITLLKPGQLGGQSEFAANFVVDKRLPKNEDQLQKALSGVMIRNRRGDGGISFTKRIVRNVTVELSQEEKALYDAVTAFVRERYEESGGDLMSALSLVTLQREVCSSRDAVFLTLVNLFKKTAEDSPVRAKIWELVNVIKQIQSNSKGEKALELIRGMNDEKVIVFTEYRASQEYLLQFFKQHGIHAVPYRGGMNRGKKDWMMDLFRGRAQVLIATEAGGEGINLQFCHQMINFDLPWNPMRVEQRIGRVHRLGQEHDVRIYNLCTLGTIEEHIVHLLHEKINLFELVIGDLDDIMERLEKEEQPLEQRLAKMLLESSGDHELRSRIDTLGSSINRIRTEAQEEARTAGTPPIGTILDGLGRTVEVRP
ncbi:ATP-dependent helicase [Paenibacillus darwinianus]|uniref:ATP-dependent helicase n=1 Tax=Paenibacillus darwinianus TaxID=1380763 RepID=A0A9W5RZ90_9BACL|nr:SNF2-related protein [Paenibacillus darwinianus]EXX84910.1 ATP-dependent helicase [Paenibacillus darwinianus]EXX84937.1 ATP-dependent helicase [Paenibacillus darwinianus]EXX84940.1 ATP-dependent helicase [Paenibacillus darwinianus]